MQAVPAAVAIHRIRSRRLHIVSTGHRTLNLLPSKGALQRFLVVRKRELPVAQPRQVRLAPSSFALVRRVRGAIPSNQAVTSAQPIRFSMTARKADRCALVD